MASLTISTKVENLLRLAWQAERTGRPNLRDALLTLAVAESGPDEAVLAERCRRLLVARQPDHWYATSGTLGRALSHGKVAAVIEKLRVMFPPVRVQRLLLRGAVEQGPFLASPTPIRRVFEGLGLIPSRFGSGADTRSPAHTLLFPSAARVGDDPADGPREIGAFYMTLLFSMAVLLETVSGAGRGLSDRDSRAA